MTGCPFSAHQNFCYVVKWNWEENYKRRISKCLFGKPQDGAWLIFFRKCKSFETWEPIVSCCTFQKLEKFKYKQLFCIRLKTESYQGILAIYLLQCVSTLHYQIVLYYSIIMWTNKFGKCDKCVLSCSTTFFWEH